jgi:hypothetical protein
MVPLFTSGKGIRICHISSVPHVPVLFGTVSSAWRCMIVIGTLLLSVRVVSSFASDA